MTEVTSDPAGGDDLDFLDDGDRRRLELIDRIFREETAKGVSADMIDSRIAAVAPASFWTIRNRVGEARFEMICKRYPGVAGHAALIRSHVRAVLGEQTPVFRRWRRR